MFLRYSLARTVAICGSEMALASVTIRSQPFLAAVVAVASFLADFGPSVQDAFGAREHDAQPPGLIANPDTHTNDSKPSLAALADGSTWMAWHAYSPGRDRISARRLHPGGLGSISPAPG